MTMKLYAIYVGGEMRGANIEVHDMRFIAAPSIEETVDELQRQWWGKPASLHIDCWAEIDHADGFDVTLRDEPFLGEERLYYVNLGGYDRAEFAEQHKNTFVVAKSIPEAKARAIKTAQGWDARHRDNMYEAERAFALNNAVVGPRFHLHLAPASEVRAPTFTCEYLTIKRLKMRVSDGR